MKTVRRTLLSQLPQQLGRAAGALAHRAGRKKIYAFRWMFGVLIALGMIGATLSSANVAHASGIGGGGCNVHYGSQRYGLWHSSLCVWGPYADSHGNLYYRVSASCWVDAYPMSGSIPVTYKLECTTLNGNSLLADYNWHTWPGNNTPQPAVSLTFPTYNVYKGVQTSIFVHYGSHVVIGTSDDPSDDYVISAVPSSGVAWTVYTP